MAAAAVAAAAVAATAASAAMQATSGGGAGSSSTRISGPNTMEVRDRQRARDLLYAGADYTSQGAFQTSQLAPYLYQLAGLQAQYDPEAQAAATSSQAEADAAGTEFDSSRTALTDAKGLKITKGQGKKAKRESKKAKKQAKAAAHKAIPLARRKYDDALAASERAKASANRITGLTPIEGKGGAPALGSEEDQTIDSLLTGRVRSALETGTSTDPRLLRELDDQEAHLRSKLSQQFGADFEGSTPGIAALAEFSKFKRESLADFARRDVAEYNPLRLNQRGSLAALAGARQALALVPAQATTAAGKSLGDMAGQIRDFNLYLQRDRLGQPTVSTTPDGGSDQTAQMLGQLGQGLGGVAASGAFKSTPTPSTSAGATDPTKSTIAEWLKNSGSQPYLRY